MNIRRLFIPIFLAFVLTFTLFEPFIATSEEISQKVLRLHILANSDTTYDQNIKLKLKNYILVETGDIFNKKTLEENIKAAQDNREYIEKLCNDFLYNENCSYSAKVYITKEYFKTRVYDDFTLPSGVYNSIKIVLGEGEGHNWWCIVFPSVCLYSCSESIDDYLTDEEMELVSESYTPKFKMIEIYEKIKYEMNY